MMFLGIKTEAPGHDQDTSNFGHGHWDSLSDSYLNPASDRRSGLELELPYTLVPTSVAPGLVQARHSLQF